MHFFNLSKLNITSNYSDLGVRLRIFVMLVMVFFITINFVAFFLFFDTKKQLNVELDQKLLVMAQFVQREIERQNIKSEGDFDQPLVKQQLKQYFSVLRKNALVENIEIINDDGVALFSFYPLPAKTTSRWYGLSEEELVYLWQETDIYSKRYLRSGSTYRAYYLPLQNRDILSDNRVFAIVRAEINIDHIVHLNSISRLIIGLWVVGILSTIIIFYLFIKAMVRPIRQLSEEAYLYRSERGELDPDSKETDISLVLHTFREMVADLQDKERRLRELYAQTAERAELIENYNAYILRSIRSGVVSLNTSGKITVFNRAAKQILDWQETDVIGQSYQVVFRNEPQIHDLVERMLQDDPQHFSHLELPINTPHKESIWLDISISVLYDNNDNMLGVTLLLTDLTEVKRLQEQINLKERLSALGEMAAGVAHEFRNSLGTIVGFTKIIHKKMSDDDPRRTLLQSIFKEAFTQETIIRDFLAFARPSKLTLSAIDLHDLLAHVCEGLSEDTSIKISKSLPEFLPPIAGDEGLLRQVFTNLIRNALEAFSTTEGEIKITAISLEKMIEIHVSDNGKGIPPEVLPKIFHPFFTTREDGIGLGLALTHKIITEHQGTIQVQSTINEGTTFTIRLPSWRS